jgi:hypothetical protein
VPTTNPTNGVSTDTTSSTLTFDVDLPGDSEAEVYALGVMSDGRRTLSPPSVVTSTTITSKLLAAANRYHWTTATMTLEDFGVDLSGSNMFDGAILAPNGKMYGVPRNSATILVIDTINHTAERTDFGATIPTGWGDGGWGYGGVLGVDGRIYCVPRDSPHCLIIDPVDETITFDDFGLAGMSSLGKWRGAVLGLDGKMYCAPRNAADILIVDTSNGTATRSNMGADLSGNNKYLGGVLSPDTGKIYCPPIERTDFLVIDPATGTATTTDFGTTIPGTGDGWRGWVSGALGPDGKLYFSPNLSPAIAIVDPVAGTLTLSDMGAGLTASDNYHSGALGPDGKIYCPPFNSSTTRVLVIDPIAGTAVKSDLGLYELEGNAQFTGATVGLDGRIYCYPRTVRDVLVIETAAAQPWAPHIALSPYLNTF